MEAIRNMVPSRRWFTLFALASMLWVSVYGPPWAFGKTLTIDADQQYRFADNYFEQKAYFNAISEYERFIHFFPQDPRVPQAHFKIGQSYFRGNRFDQAIRAFRHVIEKYEGSDLAAEAYLGISACYSKKRAYGLALTTLDGLLGSNPEPETRDKAHYRKGWIYLEMDEWNKARASFERIPVENRGLYGLDGLLADLDQKKPLTKNPRLAGTLALLPGAGHLYCERYQDALIAFVLNGAMIIAAWEAFDNDNEALGGLLTLFGLGFYSGNIYSAVNSAHKYNRKQKQDFLDSLRQSTTVRTSTFMRHGRPSFLLSCTIRF